MRQRVIKVLVIVLVIVSIFMIATGIYLIMKEGESNKEENIKSKYDNGSIVDNKFSYVNSTYESYVESMGLPNVTKVITYNDGKIEYVVGYSDDIVKTESMKEIREATDTDKVTYSKLLYEQLKQEAKSYKELNEK